ncbi:MAG: glycosyl transferase, family 39 [Acidimicrobiaceae bacterium]|nr:glycosyl transferase, family 39 [Acidimicrobiaceae bacterium]
MTVGAEPAARVAAAAPRSGAVPPGARDRRRLRRLDAVAVAVPTVLAAVLSSIELTGRSIWIDEAATASIASQHGASLWRAMANDGGNMLGYYALVHVLIGWFGDGLVVLRLPSVVAGAASVALVSLLALRLFDRRVAAVAGLLCAVSLPLVFWAQQARSYAPMVAFVAASYLLLAALVARPGERTSRGLWLAYVLVSALALYMSYVAALVFPAQLLAVAVCRRPWRRVASALAVVALLSIPLVWLAVGRGTGQLSWVPRPDGASWSALAESVTSAGFVPNFHLDSTSAVLVVLTLVALAAGGAIAARSARRRARGERDLRASFPVVLMASWLIVPVALVWAWSLIGQSFFSPRNLLMVLAPLAVLLALLLSDRRLPRPLGLFGVAVFVGLRAVPLAQSYGVSPENWNAATRFLLNRARPGDCIAFYPSDGRMAFDYYLVHRPAGVASVTVPRPVLPSASFSTVKPYVERYTTLSASELSAVASSCGRLWLVASHQGQQTGTASSQAHLRTFRGLQSALTERMGRGSTVSFGWASPVQVELFSGHRGVGG